MNSLLIDLETKFTKVLHLILTTTLSFVLKKKKRKKKNRKISITPSSWEWILENQISIKTKTCIYKILKIIRLM